MPDDNGFTLDEAKGFLAEAIVARSKTLMGESYRYKSGENERQVTRTNLKLINDDIIYWETRVRRLSSGGIRTRGVSFS